MAGADIFAQDTDGHTPFYVAAQEGYMPCVLMLIEHAGGNAIMQACHSAQNQEYCLG